MGATLVIFPLLRTFSSASISAITKSENWLISPTWIDSPPWSLPTTELSNWVISARVYPTLKTFSSWITKSPICKKSTSWALYPRSKDWCLWTILSLNSQTIDCTWSAIFHPYESWISKKWQRTSVKKQKNYWQQRSRNDTDTNIMSIIIKKIFYISGVLLLKVLETSARRQVHCCSLLRIFGFIGCTCILFGLVVELVANPCCYIAFSF